MNFQNLSEAFNYLANYSNKNFFSEDTISNEEFGGPRLDSLEIKFQNDKAYLFNSA
jgi:hypothetical protein